MGRGEGLGASAVEQARAPLDAFCIMPGFHPRHAQPAPPSPTGGVGAGVPRRPRDAAHHRVCRAQDALRRGARPAGSAGHLGHLPQHSGCPASQGAAMGMSCSALTHSAPPACCAALRPLATRKPAGPLLCNAGCPHAARVATPNARPSAHGRARRPLATPGGPGAAGGEHPGGGAARGPGAVGA
jgi:hypothetical protein